MPLTPWISKQLAEFSQHDAGFRELCERAPVGIFVVDLEDRCVYANPVACAIVGLAPDEAIDLGWTRYLHPDDGPPAFAAWEAAVAARSDFIVECRYNVPNRGLVWARSHAVPWRNAEGEVIGYLGSIQDITDERRAEDALRDKERLFRTIFQQAGMGVGVLDSRTGQFVRVNQKFCDLVGYTVEEMLQRQFQSLTHPDDLAGNEGALRDMQAGRLHTFSIEKRYVRKDGEIVWVNVTITPLWNPGEPPDLHITIVEDITQRKLAEHKVRESEERFRRLCEHAPVGIFLCDAQGQAVYINPRGCEIVGITAEQARGGVWTLNMHLDDCQRVSDLWRQAIATQAPYANESRYVHPGGVLRRTFTKAVATFDQRGQVVGWIGVILDVTEERQALEALRASEEQYRALFNATTDAIILSTLDDGRLVDVNPAACAMHGYTREEFLRLDIHDFIHHESHPLFGEYLETCRRGGVFHCEAQNIRRDGTTFDIEVYGTRLVHRGQPHALAIIRDISQRKAAETELRRQEAMLAHVSRLSTMGEMVAGIAHEVNQPIYSILNYAKAAGNVLADVDGPQMDDVRTWHDEIATAAARAGDIVRRLRDFTRRSPATQRPENLNSIVRESLGLVQHELRRAAVDVDLQLASDLPLVNVDHVQIQQVLVNLVKNASEALAAKPSSDRTLQITTRRAGERVFVDVADNGPGLPAAGGNPFEPFVTTKAEGMGLGLPISRTIVEAHGGAITAQTNSQGGATFTFHLPAATTPSP